MEKDFMNYTGDPRAVLIHFNDKHDSNGRFAKKSGGASSTKKVSTADLLALEAEVQALNNELNKRKTYSKLEKQIINARHVPKNTTSMGPVKTDDLLGAPIRNITFAQNIWAKEQLAPFMDIDKQLRIDKNIPSLCAIYKDSAKSGIIDTAKSLVDYYVNESDAPTYKRLRDGLYHGPEEYYYGATYLGERVIADLKSVCKDSVYMSEWLTSEKAERLIGAAVAEELTKFYEANRSKATNKLEKKKHEKNVVDKTGTIEKKESVTLDDIKKQYPNAPAAAINEIYKAKIEQQRRRSNASMRGDNKMPANVKHDSFMDYTGDPRAVLIHYNPNHNPKNGQFTSSPSVLMGRYIEIDEKTGKKKLTELGKARLEHDIKRNAQKKKDDQIKGTPDEIAAKLTDPHRWVTEDLNSAQQGLQNAQNMTKALKDFEQKKLDRRPKVRKKTLDLSQMTDQELNAQINRFLLEERYQDIFNPKVRPEVSKGKQWLMNTLEVAGGALAVGASAVTIAKAIHELKKGT